MSMTSVVAPAPAPSPGPLLTPSSRSRTTYAQLTAKAARRIARAQLGIRIEAGGPLQLHDLDVRAHRDLAAALVHLGGILTKALPSESARAKRRRGVPDAQLLRSLEAVARARDWTEPGAAQGPAGDLAEAAVLIRTAADLWSTHHGANGRPRSPESSRMRHPSTLGAASREWRTLVTLTATAAQALSEHGRSTSLSQAEVAALRRFPSPSDDVRPSAAATCLLDLTVARPGIRRGQPPLEELSDRVGRLLHMAWTLAEAGSAPATVHSNLATIGIALNRAATAAHHAVAQSSASGVPRSHHVEAAAHAEEVRTRWREIATQVRALRTPHPSAHPIQIERLDIDRLLSRALRGGLAPTDPEVGWWLSRIADSFSQVAAHNAVALRAAQDRGDLLLLGRAIPTEALSRRPDLLEARLTDQVIPAPTTVITRLEASYLALAKGLPQGQTHARSAPDAAPPAA